MKERLKRCGRYHTSPAAKTPTGSGKYGLDNKVTSSDEQTCQNPVQPATYAPQESFTTKILKMTEGEYKRIQKCGNISTPTSKDTQHSVRILKFKEQPSNTNEVSSIQNQIIEREEELRKLKMVEMYHNKVKH